MIVSFASSVEQGWIHRAGLNFKASGPQVAVDVCRAIVLTPTANGAGREKGAEGECTDGSSWVDVVERIMRVTGGKRRSVSS
jgi:hypothetical protein